VEFVRVEVASGVSGLETLRFLEGDFFEDFASRVERSVFA
jgi:hypothetical protein